MHWLGNNRKSKRIAILVRACQRDVQSSVLRCGYRLVICYRRIIDVQNCNYKVLFKPKSALVSRANANGVTIFGFVIKDFSRK